MSVDRQLQILVYSNTNRYRGVVANPISARFTDRWLGLGDGEFTVNAADDIVTYLLAPGARVVVQVFKQNTDPAGGLLAYDTIMSGVIRNPRGDLVSGGTVTFSVQEDWRLLQNTLARVVPEPSPWVPAVGGAGNIKPTSLSDQAQTVPVSGETLVTGRVSGLSGRMPFPTSPTVYPAETAAIFLLMQNVIARRRVAFGDVNRYVTPTDLGRGIDVRAAGLPQPRFDTIEAYVQPMLEASNLGLRVQQDAVQSPGGQGLIRFNFFTPKTWPQKFTPESGTVIGGTWSLNSPNANDAIVGGPGQEAARAFRRFSDTTLQQTYQDLIEVFRDATGAPINWPDALTDPLLKVEMYYHLRPEVTSDRIATFEAFLAAAGADVLTKGAPTSGIAPVLAESTGFRWGGTDGFHTGDILTIAPSASAKFPSTVTFTDRMTSTLFSQTKDKGLVITPTLGTQLDDPDTQLANAILALARANQRQTATR